MLIAKMYITLILPIISGIVNSIFCKTKYLKCLNNPIDGENKLKENSKNLSIKAKN